VCGETQSGPVQPAFERREGQSEHRRGFFAIQLLEVAQHDYATVLGVERLQRPHHRCSLFLLDRCRFRVTVRSPPGGDTEVIETGDVLSLWLPDAASVLTRGGIASDGEQPGAYGRLPAKGPCAAPRGEKRFLQDILAERRIGAERADEPEDRRLVPLDETVEGLPVSRFRASEECYVVFGFGVDGHVLMPNKVYAGQLPNRPVINGITPR